MRGSYHHGSLRDSLIDAALEVISESGPERLSLRDLARRAGVSSGAPYRHFADKGAILAGVAGRGFERFDRALARTAELHAEGDPMHAVEQLGVSYVRFAAEHPHLFRLMFGPSAPRAEVDPSLDDARRRAGGHLPSALARLQAAGLGTGASVEELTELAWALVHGVASLHLDGLSGGPGVDEAEALARRVTHQLGLLIGSRG